MTDDAEVWTRLGIEPTDDTRAIRKAYAARLKTIDPDTDPAAFIALREALEEALAYARECQMEDRFEPQEIGASQAVVAGPGRPAPARPPSPWAMKSVDDHAARINELLFGDGTAAEIHDPLRDETEALLRHPELDVIGRSDAIELWLADTIVEAIPRSDPMIEPAISRFGWAEKLGHWDCPFSVQLIFDRTADCRFREELAQPGHEHHRAFATLTAEPPKRAGFRLRWELRRFLREVRADHATLERDLHAGTLEWWEGEDERRRRRLPVGKAAALGGGIALVHGLAGPSLGALPAWLAAALALPAAIGWFAARAPIDRRWDDPDVWFEGLPMTPLQGAAVAALLLLPVAALLAPAGPAAVIGFALLAAALSVAAGPAPRLPQSMTADTVWQARFCVLVPFVWLHGANWAGNHWMQPLIPACAGAWVVFRHGERIREEIERRVGGNVERLGRAVRGVVFLSAAALMVLLADAPQGPSSNDSRALVTAAACVLLLLHQLLDPPPPYALEWKGHSLFSVLAVAFGGPLLALFLVFARTGRSVAQRGIPYQAVP